MKVAQVIKSFEIGGAEVLLRETFENENFVNVETDSSIIVLNKKRLKLLESLKIKKIYTFNLFSFLFITQAFKKESIRYYSLPLAGCGNNHCIIEMVGLKIEDHLFGT
jgi:hypothetical protein